MYLRRHRKGLDRVVRLAAAFDKATETDETVTFEMPEDVATLTDEQVTALREEAVRLFQEVYGDGTRTYSEEDLEILRTLRAARDVLVEEETKRAQAAAETQATARELAEGMADPDGADETAVEDAPADDDAEEPIAQAAAGGTAPLTAAAAQLATRPLTIRAGSRRPVPAAPPAPVAESPVRANTSMAGLTPGQPMSMDDLAKAYMQAEKGVNATSFAMAQRSNMAMTNRTPIGQIHVPYDTRAIVASADHGDIQRVIEWAIDESNIRGPGGQNSLLAAGGWCAPSERLYDLCQLESTDGILSLPGVQAPRGGIENTLGPDWRDIFASIGFCFTEADDIAGNYAQVNEVQSVTEGGSGLTSFTLTYSGQTTVAIAAAATAATVRTALANLPNISGQDNVNVTGSAGGPYTVTFQGTLADTNVPQMTSTPTGGSGTVTVATVTVGDSGGASSKPCNTVTCPPFVDHRLDVCGVCINAGILMNRAYPELVRRYTSGSVTAHMHRVAANVIADMVAGSDVFTVTDGDASPGVLAPILSSIELRAEINKTAFRMRRAQMFEAIFPFWVRGAIRADLSRQLGVPNDKFAITDAFITSLFTSRGVNPQFVYNFQDLALNATSWPSVVNFLMYPAGTWVKMGGEIITLEAMHDSTLNAANNYTALFTEESWGTLKTCHVSELIRVPVCPSGATQAGVNLVCTPAGH